MDFTFKSKSGFRLKISGVPGVFLESILFASSYLYVNIGMNCFSGAKWRAILIANGIFCYVLFDLVFRKLRFLKISFLTVTYLYLIFNLFYYRYFGDVPVVGLIYSYSEASMAWGYLANLSGLSDLILGFCLLAVILLSYKKKNDIGADRKYLFLSLSVCLALIISIRWFYPIYLRATISNTRINIALKEASEEFFDPVLRHNTWAHYGFLPSFARDVRQMIDRRKPQNAQDFRTEYDRSLSENATKDLPNVVVIQVESLDFSLLDLKYKGIEITPYLNSLKKSSIFFNNFYAQHTGVGGTSDAEFCSLTSMYPYSRVPNFFAGGLEYLVSLPSIFNKLGYNTIAFHGNRGSFYGRDKGFRKLGFNEFRSVSDYRRKDPENWFIPDSELFSKTYHFLRSTNNLVFAFVITISGHGPYQDKKYLGDDANSALVFDTGDGIIDNFYSASNYVDQQLRVFVQSISKVLQPCLIVIYGDHTANLNSRVYHSNKHQAFERVPLFILDYRDEEGKKFEVQNVGSHIDIPVILIEMLGLKKPPTWQGIDLINENRKLLSMKDFNGSVDVEGNVIKGINRSEMARMKYIENILY